MTTFCAGLRAQDSQPSRNSPQKGAKVDEDAEGILEGDDNEGDAEDAGDGDDGHMDDEGAEEEPEDEVGAEAGGDEPAAEYGAENDELDEGANHVFEGAAPEVSLQG